MAEFEIALKLNIPSSYAIKHPISHKKPKKLVVSSNDIEIDSRDWSIYHGGFLKMLSPSQPWAIFSIWKGSWPKSKIPETGG